MYVTSLKVENVRCFESAELSLLYPGKPNVPEKVLANVNLILGVNGAGKTTILKAIALAVLTPVLESSGFVPYHLVRRPRRPPAQEVRTPGNRDRHDHRQRRPRSRGGGRVRPGGNLSGDHRAPGEPGTDQRR